MSFTIAKRGAVAAMAVAAMLQAAPASAEFFGWQVTNISFNDVLMVRTAPTAGGQILVGYPNGTSLSLTGNCSGGLHLDQINGQSKAKQRQAVRTRWCEVWLDPLATGDFQSGWVFGKYISPL